jgi:hypothetical protein
MKRPTIIATVRRTDLDRIRSIPWSKRFPY